MVLVSSGLFPAGGGYEPIEASVVRQMTDGTTRDGSVQDFKAFSSAFRPFRKTFYNPIRIHQALGYQSPDHYEAEHAPAQAA